jgi:hypothetical protein
MSKLIPALLAYAEQRPGIDPRNYGDWRAYRREAAVVTRDLMRARIASYAALAAGVTDADIIEACRGDRLTIDADGAIDYTTGQYWPTEYRRAVARVLARAAYAARHRQPQPL